MDNTFTLPFQIKLSFPQLIKLLHIIAWSLLFCAGVLLCQRVASMGPSSTEIALAESADEAASVDVQESVDAEPENDVSAPTSDQPKATVEAKLERKKERNRKPPTRLNANRQTPPSTPLAAKQTRKSSQNAAAQPAKEETTPPTAIAQTQVKDAAAQSTNAVVQPASTTKMVSQVKKSELASSPSASPSQSKPASKGDPTSPKPDPMRSLNVSQVVDKPTSKSAGPEIKEPRQASAAIASSTIKPRVNNTAAPKKTAPVKPQQTKPAPDESVKTKAKSAPLAITPPRVIIENPLKIGYPVSFLLNAKNRTLKPGEDIKLDLKEAATANVRFDRGGSFGEQSLDLKSGDYVFQVTRQGWAVVEKPSTTK